MRDPEILLIYRESSELKTGKKFWPSPKIRSQLSALQNNIDREGIEAKSYFDVVSKLWEKTIPENNVIPLNILCSIKTIERYKILDPLTDSEMIYWVLVHIERGIAEYTINLRLRGKDWVQYEEELEDWITCELSVLGYSDWNLLKKEHPVTHRKAQNEAMNNFKELYGIIQNSYDYKELAEKVYWRINNG